LRKGIRHNGVHERGHVQRLHDVQLSLAKLLNAAQSEFTRTFP